jgi:hypothetical protein
MNTLPANHPLSRLLLNHLGADGEKGLTVQRLRASRPVFRFSLPGNGVGLVGKFFHDQVPATAQDRSLVQEYRNYQTAPARGLTVAGLIPRLLGQFPGARLGVLLEGIPGPDLDHYLHEAAQGRGLETCLEKVSKLAELLAFFHTRPLPREDVSPEPALAYFQKLREQLQAQGLLNAAAVEALAQEGRAWEDSLAAFPDGQVLLHGDATPTNFLFPDGRVVAVDLERLGPGDRLFDLSWVAGELRHAWGWRGRDFGESETAIHCFFRSYLTALPGDDGLTRRIFALNPFYMALAELRIARNSYLTFEYRRALVAEAQRCLSCGRRLT